MVAGEEIEESNVCKPPAFHQCSSTDQCIDSKLLCNEKCDCSDCTDEKHCGKLLLFTVSHKLV